MICLNLLIGFLKVGLFAFGGAYGAIPLIRDVVLSYGWLTDEALSNMIAVSESTPGPIMVNLVVLPSFVIILILMALLKNAIKNKYFQAILRGVKPAVIGIVLATGAFMLSKSLFPEGKGADTADLIMASVLALILFLPPKVMKKKLSPIMSIVVSAFLGAIVYTVFPG